MMKTNFYKRAMKILFKNTLGCTYVWNKIVVLNGLIRTVRHTYWKLV